MLIGIQRSSMSLMSVCWTLFKSVSIWESFDLACILQKEDILFKFLNNTEFRNIRTGEITTGAYLVSINEIVVITINR